MENISLRKYILIAVIGLIVVICPWLNGGLTEGFAYEVILILTALGLFLFTTVLVVEKPELAIEKKPYLYLWLGIFILALIISSFFSLRTYNSWSETIIWLAGVAIFLIFSQINNIRIGKLFCWINILMAAVVSLTGFILFLVSPAEDDLRLDSVFYNPNLLAGYLIGLWPIAMSIFFSSNQKKIKILLYILNIIIGTGFTLTVSYTGWVSFIPILAFWFIYFRKIIFTKKGILLTGLAVILIFSSVATLRYFHTDSIEQGLSIQNTISKEQGATSSSQRLYFLKIGQQILMADPFTGIGLGNMKLAYQKIQNNISEIPRSLHNNYLDLAVETGVIGIIGWLGFILILFYKNIIQLKKSENYYWLGLWLGWSGMLINGFVDFAWQIKIVVINFFIISGLLYGAHTNDKRPVPVRIIRWLIPAIILLALLFLGRGVQLFLSLNNQTQGERYEDLQSYETAVSYYKTAWQYNKNPILLSKIGILQYTLKDYSAAENTALDWIKRSPNDPAAYQLLGRIYKQQNKLPAAQEQFIKADQLVPLSNPEIKQDLIEMYFLLQNYEATITTAEAYLTVYNTLLRPGLNTNLDLNLATILDYQGKAYLALNNQEKACAAWQQALQERPAYYLARQQIDTNCSMSGN